MINTHTILPYTTVIAYTGSKLMRAVRPSCLIKCVQLRSAFQLITAAVQDRPHDPILITHVRISTRAEHCCMLRHFTLIYTVRSINLLFATTTTFVNILHDNCEEQSRTLRQVTADKGQTSRSVIHFISLNITFKRSQVE